MPARSLAELCKSFLGSGGSKTKRRWPNACPRLRACESGYWWAGGVRCGTVRPGVAALRRSLPARAAILRMTSSPGWNRNLAKALTAAARSVGRNESSCRRIAAARPFTTCKSPCLAQVGHFLGCSRQCVKTATRCGKLDRGHVCISPHACGLCDS